MQRKVGYFIGISEKKSKLFVQTSLSCNALFSSKCCIFKTNAYIKNIYLNKNVSHKTDSIKRSLVLFRDPSKKIKVLLSERHCFATVTFLQRAVSQKLVIAHTCDYYWKHNTPTMYLYYQSYLSRVIVL